MDINAKLDEIRQKIGYCTQSNVLYDDLTIEDHLIFISEIKGIPKDQIPTEINKIIEEFSLIEEKGKIIRHLSDGNKRKLSLAMAIIGDSSFLFLDEPTSGLDPISRRNVLNIINRLKIEGKTILFTTHQIDEADILANRVGIMAKGKLLALASSDFLKKKFGLGYIFSVYPQYNEEDSFQETISDINYIVLSHVKNSKRLPQKNPNYLSYLLPFSSENDFSTMFQSIEDIQKFARFDVNLEMNSLEDVFISIGLDEDKFFQICSNDNDYLNNLNQDNYVEVPPYCFSKGINSIL